eukprot:CAMPEP_0167748536 /NCGR_PEP_ID=MMETSP0110_2-20121227/4892_1 /TAXON_ID=629695 /ORGANISM="Gymnochlora sp., Strain CCMP2014" /LENGTH=311 /DNA_ID=CAMNT_0007633561 /DNA_START=235 /DNA_END=1170 /DNA_ORIENTATION=+
MMHSVRPASVANHVLVWDASGRWTGLFSAFGAALACILECERRDDVAVKIEWRNLTRYHLDSGENLWEKFFVQPHQFVSQDISKAKVKVLRRGFPPDVMGNFPGKGRGIKGDKKIPKTYVKVGQYMVRRYIGVQPHIREKATNFYQRHVARFSRPLAVHVRLTDKHTETSKNFGFTSQEIMRMILHYMEVEGFDGCMFATDDINLKDDVQEMCGAKCVMYNSTLSADGKAVHFDSKIDAYKKAEDIVLEVLIMSMCTGFLSTMSSVGNGVLFFASEELVDNHRYLDDVAEVLRVRRKKDLKELWKLTTNNK